MVAIELACGSEIRQLNIHQYPSEGLLIHNHYPESDHFFMGLSINGRLINQYGGQLPFYPSNFYEDWFGDPKSMGYDLWYSISSDNNVLKYDIHFGPTMNIKNRIKLSDKILLNEIN